MVAIRPEAPVALSRGLALNELLGRMLNVEVVGEADNAGAAVDGILKTRPDSVLLDLNLQGRSGIEVLRTVHSFDPWIRRIRSAPMPFPSSPESFTRRLISMLRSSSGHPAFSDLEV